MRASERISVAYSGVEVTNPLAQEQMSTTVWAALRKQEYVVGSQCKVMVRLSEGRYEIEAVAKEPTTDWLRLLDLVVPLNGIDPAEFERFLNEQGLASFATPPDDAVLLGGDPRKSHPDTAMVGKQPVPVSVATTCARAAAARSTRGAACNDDAAGRHLPGDFAGPSADDQARTVHWVRRARERNGCESL